MQFTVMLDGEAVARRTAQQEIESLTGLSFQDLKEEYQRRDLNGFQHLARYSFLRVEALNRLFGLS